MFHKDVVSKELHSRLPASGPFCIRWCGFWFAWLASDIKHKRLRFGTFYRAMRMANACDLTIGPIYMTIPCRWLDGSAKQLYPEIYFDKTKGNSDV